jgi:hypothetical protein
MEKYGECENEIAEKFFEPGFLDFHGIVPCVAHLY